LFIFKLTEPSPIRGSVTEAYEPYSVLRLHSSLPRFSEEADVDGQWSQAIELGVLNHVLQSSVCQHSCVRQLLARDRTGGGGYMCHMRRRRIHVRASSPVTGTLKCSWFALLFILYHKKAKSLFVPSFIFHTRTQTHFVAPSLPVALSPTPSLPRSLLPLPLSRSAHTKGNGVCLMRRRIHAYLRGTDWASRNHATSDSLS
jgi:hypothetical protein